MKTYFKKTIYIQPTINIYQLSIYFLCRCVANNSIIQALPNLKANPGSTIKATPPPKEKLLKIADLPPTVEEVNYIILSVAHTTILKNMYINQEIHLRINS